MGTAAGKLQRELHSLSARQDARMHDVVLQTHEGELVANEKMPPFREPPAVLLWGNRVFTLHAADELIYREAFAFVIPVPSTKQGG